MIHLKMKIPFTQKEKSFRTDRINLHYLTTYDIEVV